LQKCTSSFFKNFEKPTVNFGSYGKHNSWNFQNLTVTYERMIKLEQRGVLGQNKGLWELFLEKLRVSGIHCLQIFMMAHIAANI